MRMSVGEARSTRASRVDFVVAVLLAVAEGTAEPQRVQQRLALHTLQKQALEAYERTDYT